MAVSEEDVLTRLDELGIDHEAVPNLWNVLGLSWEGFLTYLVALERTFNHNSQIRNADFIVIARPDLRVDGHLHMRLLLAVARLLAFFRPNLALLPNWGRYGGLNDRFAILSRRAAPAYFTRVQSASGYFSTHPNGNSERFLFSAMSDTTVLSIIPTNMVRVRIGGIAHPSDLRNDRQPQLWAQVSRWATKSLRRFKSALRMK